MYEYSNSRTTFTFSKRERDHNDKNEHIMGNGNNDAKAGKQKQQKLLIFRLLGHEWVGQGPGVELCEHGQVDGASITANQPLDCVQVLLGHVAKDVLVGKVGRAVSRGGWHKGGWCKNQPERVSSKGEKCKEECYRGCKTT